MTCQDIEASHPHRSSGQMQPRRARQAPARPRQTLPRKAIHPAWIAALVALLAGISCGLAFMAVCDEVWVYTGAGISPGMEQELAQAKRLGLIVVDWNPFPVMFREQTE